MVGETLLHYEILRKLGEGGMGEVWLARDTRLDREVAIKLLSSEVAADPERLERFRREARAVAALNHPNIVTIFSVEEADGVPFFTMEYVEGAPLSRVIPDGGLEPDRFLELAIRIADAVGAAHESGITHRDLKPGNIMVSDRGQLKVLDFGLAKVARGATRDIPSDSHLETDFLTSEGQVLGTTPYMSPEQLKGSAVDQRSDIFSLGTILYAMATGKHPFLADSSAEVISSILSHHPPDVSEIREGLPDYLSGVIRRCLEKAPENRYQSVRGLEDDLEILRERLRSGKAPPTVALSGSKSRFRPRVRVPWRGVAAFAAAAAVVLAAVLIGRTVGSKPALPLTTLAVRPFANLTGNAGFDQLAEGLSAGLMSRLREEESLRVAGRTEAWAARDESPAALAARLGVGSVVDGEILEQGSRLGITLSLTDTATGLVLWSSTYTAPGAEIYDLQRTMVGDLATFLSIPLSERDRRRLARDPQGADKALDYYVTGRRFLDRVDDLRGPDAAAENFRQALRLDPDFTLAHVGLSEALWEISERDLDSDALAAAEEHARKASELDPELAEARLALARVYRSTGRRDEALGEVERALASHPRADDVQRELARNLERAGDLEGAERSFRAAASLRPDDWNNWNALGNFYARSGQYEEARDAYLEAAEVAPPDIDMPREKLATYSLQVGEIEAAIDIYESLPKPIRSPRLASNLATAYFFSERPDRWRRAEENYLLAVRLSPQDPMYQANLGDLYARLERLDEAQQRYRLACDLYESRIADDTDNPILMAELAFTSAKATECDRALGLARQLEDLLPDTGPNAHQLAYVYALCGERDSAVQALARAVAHGESVELIRQEDEFRSLRDRPDFQALVAREPAG